MTVYIGNDNNSSERWESTSILEKTYECGYCGSIVSSAQGMSLNKQAQYNDYRNTIPQGVFICTNCKLPSFIYMDQQVPGNRFGSSVKNVPDSVNSIYEEARSSFSVNAYTAVVLLCRKLLMHVAVDLGADGNKNFVHYVSYLYDNHYVTANSSEWVDAIRNFGNNANHEIVINTKDDAEKMIKFSEMILRTNYEYPAMMENND